MLSHKTWRVGQVSTFIRITVCIVVGTIAVASLIAYQQSTSRQSNAQVLGAGMITLVLTWVLTGIKAR